MTTVRASAHPNIALVKYWGKQDKPGNIPAVPSLSITLDTLTSVTEVSEASSDSFFLDGKERIGAQGDLKLGRFLEHLRTIADIPPLRINSSNNFPTAAGLASSASGFAALVTAVNELCELKLSTTRQSELARVGSASAARSIYGGFVGLTAPDFQAQPLQHADHWPLQVAVAITDTEQKPVSSTKGMTISANTSPYYKSWVSSSQADYMAAEQAITKRDFAQLATVSEHSCLKMHAVMQSSQPALMYWNPASIACMQKIATLQNDGVQAFYTIDAGPQIKAVCTQESLETVAAALAETPGVISVERVALGGAARLGP